VRKKWKFLFSGGLFAYFLAKQKVRTEKNNDKLQQQLHFKYYIIKAYELSICLN
jgi:hypothetical protein